eukprot:6278682-Pyramimonas_sp.AAC.1
MSMRARESNPTEDCTCEECDDQEPKLHDRISDARDLERPRAPLHQAQAQGECLSLKQQQAPPSHFRKRKHRALPQEGNLSLIHI